MVYRVSSYFPKGGHSATETVPRRHFVVSMLSVLGVRVSVTFHLTCVHISFTKPNFHRLEDTIPVFKIEESMILKNG